MFGIEKPAASNPIKTPTRRAQFKPPQSSPLSPRCNLAGLSLSSPSKSTMQTSQASQNNNTLPSPPRSPPQFLVPKRQFRPIPTKTSSEEQRNARRNLFLKKVQHGREEHAWKQRGGEEEIMRMIFVAEHKRREALLEKQASKISTIYEEESEEAFDDRPDEEVPEDLFPEEFLIQQAESLALELPSDEFDDYLGQDDKELEELLASMDLGLDAKRK